MILSREFIAERVWGDNKRGRGAGTRTSTEWMETEGRFSGDSEWGCKFRNKSGELGWGWGGGPSPYRYRPTSTLIFYFFAILSFCLFYSYIIPLVLCVLQRLPIHGRAISEQNRTVPTWGRGATPTARGEFSLQKSLAANSTRSLKISAEDPSNTRSHW